jgi:pyruvate, orthophosphate dikinase
MDVGITVEVKDLIRQIGAREPLNPYQASGMAAVINRSGIRLQNDYQLDVEGLGSVMMVLDRTGEDAAPYLIAVRHAGNTLTLCLKYPPQSLEELTYLTSFKGRRQAIRENLIPVLCEIPNWLDLVRVLSRYSLERDETSLQGHAEKVMEIIVGFLFAAIAQPFDSEARAEGEYSLCRLVESIFNDPSESSLDVNHVFIQRSLDFLAANPFRKPINSFDRRVLEISLIRSALQKRQGNIVELLLPLVNTMASQALLTALDEINPCSPEIVERLEQVVAGESFVDRERFSRDVLERISSHGADEIEKLKQLYGLAVDGEVQISQEELTEGVAFIESLGDEWQGILHSFMEMIDVTPARVQEAFSEVLASQILEIEKPEVKQLLIEGLCGIVVRLEKTRKQASRDLVNTLAELFLDRFQSSCDTSQVLSALKAIEALGITFGNANYFLMARELMEHLVSRTLIPPREKKYTIEDDDTGEPLVLAEESGANEAHVQHIKSLLSIIASNPRIMHRLTPYLIVQIEIGQAQLCDEDLIQIWISRLLRANSSVTHFLIRTLIKAIPYSFKEIGPLDTLRLTAAGLARELANRGIKPIGNFLGKLRGDIHWRGSIENLYFCQGIVKYLATGDRQAIAEWMPPESMPYLAITDWCSPVEAAGIMDLCLEIFSDYHLDLNQKDGMAGLVLVDIARYQDSDKWPEFSRRIVLDMVELVKGLHHKYFIHRQSVAGSTVQEDLEQLDRIIVERLRTKENLLTPDIREPFPEALTLTEGTDDWAQELARISRDQPGTPIILRAKKAGHAYAQKATYIEERFEAFNKDLGQEAQQETLATSINNTHFEAITLDSLPLALTFLDYLVRGISVNGHSSYYLAQAGSDLRKSGELGLTFDKVRDILKVIKKEVDDIHALYRSWFEEPFDDFLASCPMERLPRKLRDLTTLKHIPETDFFKNYLKTLYVSDLQARDGNLRVLETFIDKVELFLNQRLAESGRRVFGSAEVKGPLVPFYFPGQDDVSPCKIGQKASLLHFAENTPPYFVITTDQPLLDSDKMVFDHDFRTGLASAVEKLGKVWRRSLGDPSDPALFSVRSGARMSMPGMMTTVTNVGINDEIAESLAKKVGPWFAYDCYRRFLQDFGQSVFGVERDEFQEIIDGGKAKFNVLRKASMSADQMKSVSFDYKRRLAELAPEAIKLLDNGQFLEILIRCAVAVLHSFESPSACKYREAAGIDGNWRTSVIIQSMVYGNMELESSGTGVVSYNPLTMDLRGDFALGDQGTDVVDGKVVTIPVHDPWKSRECLASQMPLAWKQLYSTLFRTAERLHFDTRIEYTIEKGKVFILQIRKDRERKERIPSLRAFGYRIIAQGMGVSGKIFRGIMVTDRNQIAPFRHINKAQSIIEAMNENLSELHKLDGFIFVVNDPIPEEIMEEIYSLPVATALVSRLGGGAAHAADVSKSLGKVYVGQVMQIEKFSGRPESVKFNDLEVVVGSKMVIHGQTGEVALYSKP